MSDQIAIITGEDAPNLTADGKQLSAELQNRGYSVEPVLWTHPGIEWDRFEGAVLRSCWGYYASPSTFRDLIDTVEQSGATLLNRSDIVRWNLHKSYLRDLKQEGIGIIPTEVVEETGETLLKETLQKRDWDEAVVKPIIGTSAAGVWKVTKDTATTDQDRFESGFQAARRVGEGASTNESEKSRLSERGALIQQFIPEVGAGELSLVFFRGEFSHAWKSIRAPAELGVEPRLDENNPGYTPSPSTIEFGSEVLNILGDLHNIDPSDVPYARVDCIKRNGELLLMELELIEPYLNLSISDAAVVDFATAIEFVLKNRS